MKWPFVTRKRYGEMLELQVGAYRTLLNEYDTANTNLKFRDERIRQLLADIAERDIRDQRRAGTKPWR